MVSIAFTALAHRIFSSISDIPLKRFHFSWSHLIALTCLMIALGSRKTANSFSENAPRQKAESHHERKIRNCAHAWAGDHIECYRLFL